MLWLVDAANELPAKLLYAAMPVSMNDQDWRFSCDRFEIVFTTFGDIMMTLKNNVRMTQRLKAAANAAQSSVSSSSKTGLTMLCASMALASLLVACGGDGVTSGTSPNPTIRDQVQAVGDAPLITTGNPYESALQYLDLDYVAKVGRSLALVPAGSNDAKLVNAAKQFSTFVWLDRLAAIDGSKATGGAMGLVNHLDAALAQPRKALAAA
jgi:hypothetical protein